MFYVLLIETRTYSVYGVLVHNTENIGLSARTPKKSLLLLIAGHLHVQEQLMLRMLRVFCVNEQRSDKNI